ncbi:hypothetical protein ABZV65_19545 [Streptomyces bauhiniae]|uniref:hypothetical protein n=1 Tax=Streptomyces bauhiniae TaxID=2340725 RepID=UPI0033A0C58F
MTRPTDRFTLAAIVVAAVLAASLATTWTPAAVASPPLTWATVYTAAVMGLAKATHLPPARTLFAATLLIAVALQVALTGVRHAIDQAITGLAYLQAAGTAKLATPYVKAA